MLEILDITQATPADQSAVRVLRNQPNVRKFMYTDHVISEDEHAGWLASLKGNKRQLAFVVYEEGRVIGLAAFNLIDAQHKKCDWAFYLDETLQGKGLGAKLELLMIDKAFNDLGIEKLNCEVLATNPVVIRLHKKFGFVEEGVRRANVIKEGQRVDVYLLGLLKTEWAERKRAMSAVLARL